MRRPCRADLKTSSSPVRTEAGHRTTLRGGSRLFGVERRWKVDTFWPRGRHTRPISHVHKSSRWQYSGVQWAQRNCPQPLREEYGTGLQIRVAATYRGNKGGCPA